MYILRDKRRPHLREGGGVRWETVGHSREDRPFPTASLLESFAIEWFRNLALPERTGRLGFPERQLEVLRLEELHQLFLLSERNGQELENGADKMHGEERR